MGSSPGSGFTNLIANSTFSGPTTNTLSLNNIPQSLSGNMYRCLVMNPCGDTTISSVASLTVAQAATPTGVPSANSICAGDTVVLAASGAHLYQWVPSAVLSDPNAAVTTGVLQQSTNFLLTGIDTTTGCSGTTTVQVLVEDAPTLTISTGTSNLCVGQSSWATVSGASSYVWSSDSTLVQVTADSIVVTPLQTQDYLVEGFSPAGCSSIGGASFTVNPLPELEWIDTVSGQICHWDTVLLDATGADSWLWIPNTGIVDSSGATVMVSPDTITTYQLVGITQGCSDTLTWTVDAVICIPDGVDEVPTAQAFEVSYAVAGQHFVLRNTSNSTLRDALYLLNTAGQVVWHQQVRLAPQEQLNIPAGTLAAGLYIIKGSSAAHKVLVR